jgi:methionyl-tRNA synthetase
MLREDSGLGDLCISRPKSRLEWGIELPFDRGYVCYVWFDALINYLTGIGYPEGEQFTLLWGASNHLIAKDILKPHAIFWPTMLHALGLEPVHHLNVHGYWNVDDRKVSKSLGNMVSPLIMDEKYGFESFRYYLLRQMSFGVDASFNESEMVARINADLANNLGNLVSRTLNMTARFAEGRVPAPAAGGDGALEREVRDACAEAVDAVDQHMDALEPHRALEAIFRAVDATNRYLEQREPWKAAKDDRAATVPTTLYTCCEALRVTALLLAPFLPEASAAILARLGAEGALESARLPGDAAWGQIAVGSATTKGDALFPRRDAPEDANAGGND